MFVLTYPIEQMLFLFLAATVALFAMRYGYTHITEASQRLIESRVQARTRELQVLHGNQRRMILDLSHNLQTPVAVLKGRIERFERTMLHDGNVNGLGQCVDALSGFITELLALADLDYSLESEVFAPFSLSACIHDLLEESQIITEGSSIQFESAIAPDIFFVGNEKRITDALRNLVSNAVKYMGNGSLQKIHLSLAIEDDCALIQVSDTGMGIAEEELPKVFDRFFRGTTRSYGTIPGTGLGLSIVKRIVDGHAGEVLVESELGFGTTFTVSLPLQKQGRSRKNRS